MTTAGKVSRGRYAPGEALCQLWKWLSGSGYQPEQHYMRGGSARKLATDR